ncbi:MAG: TerC/Alx family metal homeostasis membrane protein [Alphaproteobacteria bacterium]|nr:TerC/Alx family metal homeostasis membrane protein [Alphaproteobacteria bacterium]
MGGYSITSILIFSIIVILCLIVDLCAHKSDKEISIKSAALWTVFWIVVSLAFGLYVYLTHGKEDANAYLSGYILEKTLSVDNLFVLMAIFASFGIPNKFQHRVLYYGILGALILRLIFVGLGSVIISSCGKPALTVLGVFIIWTAFKMMQAAGLWALIISWIKKDMKTIEKKEEETDFTNHWSIRFFRRFFPVTSKIDGHNFFVKGAATPLFLCLITIEFADVMFAFDSVPAIIAITEKPFLVYTSNIFAILGMRSMYFCLAAAKQALVHLEKAVIAILMYIGIKMLIGVFFEVHVSSTSSLIVVLSFLGIGILASLLFPAPKKEKISV